MSNSSWWATKLGNPTPTYASPTPPVSPQPQMQSQMPQAPYIPPSQSQQVESSCPNCRSGNYGKLTAETRARCYDCGYPIVQQGSGIGTTSSSNGPAQPARQASGDGFNPGTIVGKI